MASRAGALVLPHVARRCRAGHAVPQAAMAMRPYRQQLLVATATCSRQRNFCVTVSALEKRRKQLTWRAKSRGWLELDVLMGTFTEKYINTFDDAQLDDLEEVLELEGPDLFKWFTGQVDVPEEILENKVMTMMLEYIKTDHPSGIGRGFTQ
mmetsp:Transcript_68661/g.128095  ORF Transcript_68661/g.128095 Transcript_68661/m.128095 type:complete len:152 (+) Transcript_68661:73-528(+)